MHLMDYCAKEGERLEVANVYCSKSKRPQGGVLK